MLNISMDILRRSILLTITLLLTSCSHEAKYHHNIVVSIAPLKYIVSAITGNDFNIEVLLPPGTNPESYEPTPKQLITTSQAELVFSTGLIDFEKALIDRVQTQNTHIVNVSKGVALIEEQEVGHAHCIDPHIWTSPLQLKKIATNVYNAIALLYPDSIKYTLNYNDLKRSIDSLDQRIRTSIKQSNSKQFLIYHPALSYYARDYDLIQISLEKEGKEPSAEHLKQFILLAKKNNLSKILYQKQFSQASVQAVADILLAEPVEIDPLGEDIPTHLWHITKCITTK